MTFMKLYATVRVSITCIDPVGEITKRFLGYQELTKQWFFNIQ